ncbi:MAG TPA: M14 family metallocarboxypeptidase, partial [Luteolibacter sp.]|nr:M14 family metallocarboxypeptidase [Luteolibacter sp.]
MKLETYLPSFRAAAQAQGFEESVLAQTPAGPLSAWTRDGGGKSIYLSAGMHGDEPAGPLALLELLREGFFSPAARWAICPALNPTGLAAGTRDNAQGIDLNRDYRLRSTDEVRAHAGWLDARSAPDLFLSLHEDWETRGFYLYEINQGVDAPQRARAILQAVDPWFDAEPGIIDGHRVREAGWIYHAAEPDLPEGWPEAIHLAKLGCPLSFTFETPSKAPLEERVAAHVAAVKAAL